MWQQTINNHDLFGQLAAICYLIRFNGSPRLDLKVQPSNKQEDYLNEDRLNAIIWNNIKGKIVPRKTSASSHFIKCHQLLNLTTV